MDFISKQKFGFKLDSLIKIKAPKLKKTKKSITQSFSINFYERPKTTVPASYGNEATFIT
jgi:hypothetical protein